MSVEITGAKVQTRDTLIETLSKGEDSALRRYQEIHVGSRSALELLRYELLTFFLSPLPGALGLFCRTLFYKWLFAEVGRSTVFGPNVILRCPNRIKLGCHVFVDANAVLDAKGTESIIEIGDFALLGKDSVLSCLSASIRLGDDVSLGPGCYLRAGLASVAIGSHVTIGAHSAIVSGSPGYKDLEIPMKKQIGSAKGIVIGDDVWLGVGVKVIDGVQIGNGCVIGAGAVVIQDIPAYSIAAGVPARVLSKRQ
jgi:acetyltransferase-like isoleucine patch superfamily enzyme